MEPFPLDQGKLTLVGALLKKGAYRSAAQYLYSIKKQHLALGGGWGPDMVALFQKELRARSGRTSTRGRTAAGSGQAQGPHSPA